MKKRKSLNHALVLFLSVVILFTSVPAVNLASTVSAATSSRIKLYNFIKLTVEALGLDEETTYLNAALKAGIVKEGDFSNYKKYTTRTDAAVILNRADEYLHGDTVDPELLKLVLNSRISDIKKIDADKREAVAKIYTKGFMKGYSNGYYIKSREFRGNEYMTTAGAKNVISMLKNTKKRAKLSPDGQLIRTTNLPKNAKDYPYILETYPNSFYEMKFKYQRARYYYEPKELVDYARPVKFTQISSDMEEVLNKYLDTWIDRIETNLKTRLNVNYMIIDNTWINTLRSTYTQYKDAEINKRKTDDIKKYVSLVKKNKIVIKSKVITVEPSTLYKNDAGFYMRTYVKFKVDYSGSNLTAKDILYGDHIWMPGLKKGKWFEGIYDIRLSTINGNSDGSDFYITDDSLMDYND
ncbi:MAG: SLH domain-containing protein [Lachnoclostridium sp.]